MLTRMNALLLTGGRLVDPANRFDATADLLITDGKVAAIGQEARAATPADRRPDDDGRGRRIHWNRTAARIRGGDWGGGSSGHPHVRARCVHQLDGDSRAR